MKEKPAAYAAFLGQLAQRGLLRFDSYRDATMGMFFVPPKSGSAVRLVFDTRQVNLAFRTPWHVNLPSAAALGSLEIAEEGEFVQKQADVSCAFYRIACPAGLESYFVLPAIMASELQRANVPGAEHFAADSLVSPMLTVLPMGFNWSLYFCQRMLEGAMERVGFTSAQFVRDREPAPDIQGERVGLAIYVDGVGVCGTSETAVTAAHDKVIEGMHKSGMIPGEIEETAEQVFVGLNFDRRSGRIAVKSERV